MSTAIALARATHPGPTVSVTIVALLIGVAADLSALRLAILGVVILTHHPHHAYLVGNRFIVLKLGRLTLDRHREEITLGELTAEMAGGQELAEIEHELGSAEPGETVDPEDPETELAGPGKPRAHDDGAKGEV